MFVLKSVRTEKALGCCQSCGQINERSMNNEIPQDVSCSQTGGGAGSLWPWRGEEEQSILADLGFCFWNNLQYSKGRLCEEQCEL